MSNQWMGSLGRILTGRGTRTAAGAVLVTDGLIGIDLPGGRKRAGIFGSLVLIVIGVVFVWFGLWWNSQQQPFPDGVSTTATVTEFTTSRGSEGQTMYRRTLTFTTEAGERIEIAESQQSSKRPVIGSVATVSYLPQDPGSARVVPDNPWLPYSFIAAGALAGVFGVVIFCVRLTSLITGIYLLTTAKRQAR
ncbi:DUF3592 domain-containing protein [Micromonospora sp. WMMD1082]|uniref:DUF3592 domain-containing protein n=1 Tax=Micromonospora sp. WMMD1082 TaxID=3016104 RepID=UPI002416D207|nr:DUF3592 domain-containing protein [Micromonospora sp. WMMD1082]MDG4795746.1 DUF3592 domain-containing protein [Micromonospora sp. WMMD1082]